MKEEIKCFKFKSVDPYFTKEKYGFKPNTIRNIDYTDERFKELLNWVTTDYKIIENLDIVIMNPKTNQCFRRRITDISVWNDLMIISWKH